MKLGGRFIETKKSAQSKMYANTVWNSKSLMQEFTWIKFMVRHCFSGWNYSDNKIMIQKMKFMLNNHATYELLSFLNIKKGKGKIQVERKVKKEYGKRQQSIVIQARSLQFNFFSSYKCWNHVGHK